MFLKNWPKIFAFVILLTFLSHENRALGQTFELGTVLCGAEFGETNLPGKYNRDYTYPTKKEIAYFAKKGFKVVTLPFKWERVQRTIDGELDSTETLRICQFIETSDSFHLKVILTMQNFATYMDAGNPRILGSRKLPNKSFKDVWQKLAAVFSRYHNIYGYDIMNEPQNIEGRRWRKAAQAAIDGIRDSDASTPIIIDGERSSFSQDWPYLNSKLRKLKDPADALIYDAHCYFDYNHSGRYDGAYEVGFDPQVGLKRAKPFVEWLKRYEKRGIIGEFGVPKTEPKWFEAMDRLLDYLKKENVPAVYWAAGPWWGNYPLSIEPGQDDSDQPQLFLLRKYLSP